MESCWLKCNHYRQLEFCCIHLTKTIWWWANKAG